MQGAIDGGAFRVTGSVYDGLPDLPTILLTALEVARALEYLHSKNILHGALALQTNSSALQPAYCQLSLVVLADENGKVTVLPC